MTTYTDIEATAFAGYNGTPGDQYRNINATMRQLIAGGFELKIVFESGSNQGHLEPHDVKELRARGDTPKEAIEELRGDVYGIQWLDITERRQLLRDLQYECDDTSWA